MKRLLRTSLSLACIVAIGCGGAATGERTTLATSAETHEPPQIQQVDVQGALLPPMPVPVTSFGGATDGTYIYVLGGYHGTPHAYSREGQSRSLWRVRVDGKSGWEEIGRMDEGLQGHALVAHGQKLCRFGGNTVDNAEGEPTRMRSVADAACFTDGRWEPLPAMPAGRSSHQAVLAGDTVYVAGGWKLEGDASTGEYHRTLLALDLGSNEWRAIDAPFARRALGLAAAAGKIVAVGGLGEDRSVSSQVDVYDPETGEWTRGPDFPGDAFGIAAVGIGDTVFASGRDGVIRRWRVGEPGWQDAASLAFPRFFHLLFAVQNELIAVGGISGMHTHGRTAHVERIALDEGPSLATWTMPYPGAAKNRQAMFIHDDFLYLFGGNNSLEQHDFEPENFQSEGWRLHLPSMRWERIADYPQRRQTMQTFLAGDHGISVGGFGHDGTAAVSHPEAYVFDFARGTWQERAGLPGGRTQFGLVAHGDRLYVLGGLDYDPAREGEAAFNHVTSILSAPIADASAPFTELEDVTMPGPRRAFASAALGDRIYLVGGMRERFQLVDDCVAFDVTERSFAPITCPSRPRLSGDMVAIGDRLYLASGGVRVDGSIQPDRSIEAYDPSTDRWSTVIDELPFDTRHMRMLRLRNHLLLVSTHNDEGRILLALVKP